VASVENTSVILRSSAGSPFAVVLHRAVDNRPEEGAQ
jgi:hypothetical protein